MCKYNEFAVVLKTDAGVLIIAKALSLALTFYDSYVLGFLFYVEESLEFMVAQLSWYSWAVLSHNFSVSTKTN